MPETTKSPTKIQSLSGFIADQIDELSRSQRDVAQYIVDHLDEAAFSTAEELARRANTSSSTVVRFSQALGFDGFPELQAAAREEYRRRPSESGAVESSGPLFDMDQSPSEAVLAADHGNIAETAAKLDRDSLAAAVEAISSAEMGAEPLPADTTASRPRDASTCLATTGPLTGSASTASSCTAEVLARTPCWNLSHNLGTEMKELGRARLRSSTKVASDSEKNTRTLPATSDQQAILARSNT